MAQRDFTSALARLLSERRLREHFAKDPRAVARELEVRTDDVETFRALDPADLELQADALLQKRFYEVAQLLPQTTARLGEHAYARFLVYAEQVWPEGHCRHWLDALGFGKFLRQQRAAELCRAEFQRIQFIAAQQRFSIAFVRENSALPKLQILYRRKGEPRQIALKIGP